MQVHDICFIRHAESHLNTATIEFGSRNNLPHQWELLCQFPAFLREVRYNHGFIDCSITQKGKEECFKAREKILNHFQPDVILVSPLERTLETCHHLFSNLSVPVFVEPILSEAFRSSCDLSSQIGGKMQRFPHYNFESVAKEGELWFLKNECQQNQFKYIEVIEQHRQKPLRQKNKIILEYMARTLTQQSPQNIRLRSLKIKEMLNSYKKIYRRIAVVSHFNIIKFTVAREFKENHEPLNFGSVMNCEIRLQNLENLLKYQ